MFDDAKSKRAWRRYRLRTELMLGGVARDVRRQILEDLDAHMRDAVAAADPARPEFERVIQALAGLGEPQDFIAPLLADTVLQRPSHRAGPAASLRAIADYAAQGGAHLLRAVAIVALAAGGAGMAMLAVMSVLRPGLAGVYAVGADEIQIRLFGLSGVGGTPVYTPWLELTLGLIGAVFIFISWRLLRRTVAELLVRHQ